MLLSVLKGSGGQKLTRVTGWKEKKVLES